ncbi:hypothetical protein [Streptomyces tanashiensis]
MQIDADHAPAEPAVQAGVGLDGTQDPAPRAVRRTLPDGLTRA